MDYHFKDELKPPENNEAFNVNDFVENKKNGASYGSSEKEATAFENTKAKLKELEELKLEVTELRFGLENSEARNKKLSVKVQELEKLVEEQWKDMQKLNEIYSIDHADYLELQDSYSKLEALSKEYQNQIEALSMESKSLELEIVNTKNELAETPPLRVVSMPHPVLMLC
jgi:chromosome segregation ATPase